MPLPSFLPLLTKSRGPPALRPKGRRRKEAPFLRTILPHNRVGPLPRAENIYAISRLDPAPLLRDQVVTGYAAAPTDRKEGRNRIST